MMQENVVSTTKVYLTRENIREHYIQKGLEGIERIKFHGADKNGKLSRWDIFTAGILQIWAIGIVDGREVSPRLQSLGFSTRVQINFSQQTITVSTYGGSGIIISQLFVHFFLVSSPLALRIRRNYRKQEEYLNLQDVG